MKYLTDRQSEVLEAIIEYSKLHSYPPSRRDLCSMLYVSSTNAVQCHLSALERKGYIRIDPVVARGIVVLGQPE